MALVLDTGILVASLDRRDKDHSRCRKLIEDAQEMRVVPAPTIPEIDYLVDAHGGTGAMLTFLRDIESGAYIVEDVAYEDYSRIEELIDTYSDADVGFVDAAVLAITERMGETKLATLDRRHFSLMRPKHVKSLKLLPT